MGNITFIPYIREKEAAPIEAQSDVKRRMAYHAPSCRFLLWQNLSFIFADQKVDQNLSYHHGSKLVQTIIFCETEF